MNQRQQDLPRVIRDSLSCALDAIEETRVQMLHPIDDPVAFVEWLECRGDVADGYSFGDCSLAVEMGLAAGRVSGIAHVRRVTVAE